MHPALKHILFKGVGLRSAIVNPGTTIFDWAAVTPTFTGTTASKSSVITYNGQASALKLVNTSSPVADVTGLSVDFTNFKSLTVPIYRAPGTGKTVVSVFATKGGFTNFFGFYIVVDDVGWAEYLVPTSGILANGSPTYDAGYTQLRFRLQDSVGQWGYAVGAGDVYIGNPVLNRTTRPKLLFTFDDNLDRLVTNPFLGKTCKTILDSYGIKGTAYVITRTFGATGHESVATLQALKTAGWDICNHSWAHPLDNLGAGLRLLGPYGYAAKSVLSVDTTANTLTTTVAHNILAAASTLGYYYAIEFIGTDLPAPLTTGVIYYPRQTSTTAFTLHPTWQDAIAGTNTIDLTTAGTAANFTYRFGGSANDHTAIQADLQRAMDDMVAAGFTLDDAKHLALPQIASDSYVVTACENLGLISVRASGRLRNTGGNVAGVVSPSNPRTAAREMNLGSGLALDGTPTEAEILAYIDEIISQGATGAFLCHALTTPTVTKLEAACAYAKTKSDAGLLDIVTIKQWWAGFARDRVGKELI